MTASAITGITWSSNQRERGNLFYKSASDNFGPTVRITRLDSALTCYQNAMSCADSEEEEVSAMKNIAMASWRLAGVHVEAESSSNTAVIQRHFMQALKHFCLAYLKRFCKNSQWGNKLEGSWEKCLTEATDWLATLETNERIAGFSEALASIPDCRLKANGFLQYATLIFHEGLAAWQRSDFKACFKYMKESYFPLQEAERLSEGDHYINAEVRVLVEDVYLHTCVAESSMARTTGDNLLETNLKEAESMNTDMVWTVIDQYKEAALLCRDKDLEQEAIAYSRIGRVYGKVLKLPSRGKDYYKQAIQMALSMSPRNFHGVEWYMEATSFVEEFQRQISKGEVDNKEKNAALEEMKDEIKKLKKLDETNNGDEDFVKELYKTWPPKAPGAQYEEGLSKKKMLVKAISHYHPDKVNKELHGTAWFYFSGEITKILNNRYTRQKFPEDYS